MITVSMWIYGKPSWDIEIEYLSSIDSDIIRIQAEKIHTRLNKIADNIDILQEKGFTLIETSGAIYALDYYIPSELDAIDLDELRQKMKKWGVKLDVVNIEVHDDQGDLRIVK